MQPGAALSDVKVVKLSADRTTGWVHKLMPDDLESGPYVSVLPPALAVSVSCLLKPEATWVEPPQENFVTEGETNIVFELKPPDSAGGSPPVTQRSTSTAARCRRSPRAAAAGEARSRKRRRGGIAVDLGGGGEDAFTFALPEFEIAEIAQTEEDFATEVARALTEETPEGVFAVVRQGGDRQSATTLEIPMTYTQAVRLAGVLDRRTGDQGR